MAGIRPVVSYPTGVKPGAVYGSNQSSGPSGSPSIWKLVRSPDPVGSAACTGAGGVRPMEDAAKAMADASSRRSAPDDLPRFTDIPLLRIRLCLWRE